MKRFPHLLAAIGLFAATLPAARAQDTTTLTVLHRFDENTHPAAALVQGADGDFYGVTANDYADAHNTVFQITPDGVFTTLHTFDGTDGTEPTSLIQAADGNLYGTTARGGANDCGTVFRLAPDGTLTTLYAFNGKDGDGPQTALLQAADGNFYGTTANGGPASIGRSTGGGTVFRLTPDGALTTLHAFDDDYGDFPQGALIQATDGNFYGTTLMGGTYGSGQVFQLTPGGDFHTVYSFYTSGYGPAGALAQGADGNFYGTTRFGGTLPGGATGGAFGTVFRLTPDGTLTTLHTFDQADGIDPTAGLIVGADGNLYGTVQAGGYDFPSYAADAGTVFEITPGGALTILRAFNGTDGQNPAGGLVQGRDGSLYGATSGTGFFAANVGTIFRLSFRAAPVVPVISVSAPVSTARSKAGLGSIVFTLSGPAATDLQVPFSVGGSAKPGVDYRPLPRKVKIKAGETTQVLVVFTIGHGGNSPEVLRLKAHPGNGYTLGDNAPAKLKLTPYVD